MGDITILTAMKFLGYHYTFSFTRGECDRISQNYNTALNGVDHNAWFQDIPEKIAGDVSVNDLTSDAEGAYEYHNHSDEKADDTMFFEMVVSDRCDNHAELAAQIWDRMNSYL